MFDSDSDNRSATNDWIRANYGDVLGPHAALLDEPGGLDVLLELVRSGKIVRRREF